MKSILKKGASCIGVAHNFAWAAFFHRKSFFFFADPPLQKNLCKKQFSSLQFSEGEISTTRGENTVWEIIPFYSKKNVSKRCSGILVLVLKGHHLPQFVISTLCPFVNYRQILEEGTNKSKPSSVEGKMSGINWPHHIIHSGMSDGRAGKGADSKPWGWGFESRCSVLKTANAYAWTEIKARCCTFFLLLYKAKERNLALLYSM